MTKITLVLMALVILVSVMNLALIFACSRLADEIERMEERWRRPDEFNSD